MYSTKGERILSTASRLFYADGITSVGVDRISEESGVSKPTLYAQFGTKAELVAAVLQRRRDIRRKSITREILDQSPGPDGKVLALFDRFLRNYARPDFRGCPFTVAAAELPDPGHPARVAIAGYKTWLQDALARMALDDGIAGSPAEAQSYAALFALLIDGAHAEMITSGDRRAMRRARDIAAGVIADLTGPHRNAQHRTDPHRTR
jgi:AcrR family transcriptional regulator